MERHRDKSGRPGRAVELLGKIHPRSHLLFADASDTFIANAPKPRDVAPSSFLVSAECNSFPLCYKSDYAAKIPWFAACRTSREGACFLNSGAYMAQPKLMVRVLDAWLARVRMQSGVEKNEDQSALHHMLLSQEWPIVVDGKAGPF